MGQNPAQPLVDWENRLQKLSHWAKNQDSKPQVMNWKPEPNEEQKAQIKRESKAADDPKLGGAKKATPAAKKKTAARKRQ